MRYTPTSASVQFRAPVEPRAEGEVNGTIYVPATRTNVKVHLSKGDLAIGGVTGWIEVNIDAGNIEAKSLQGYFSAVTKSGDLRIEMAGSRWEGHGFTAATQREWWRSSSRGLLGGAPDGDAGGHDQIDYPEQEVDGEKGAAHGNRHKNGLSLKASVGTGGAPIRLSTAAGNIASASSRILRVCHGITGTLRCRPPGPMARRERRAYPL